MNGTSRHRRVALGLGLALVVAGVAGYFVCFGTCPATGRLPAPVASDGAAPAPPVAPSAPVSGSSTQPAAASASSAPPAPDVAPPASPASAASPADMPPPTAISTVDQNPPIEPERPQTPEWKLEKREQIAEAMSARLVRLEQEIHDAEAAGDAKAAASLRVLLDRSRRRVLDLQREIAERRQKLGVDPTGAPPAGAGAHPAH